MTDAMRQQIETALDALGPAPKSETVTRHGPVRPVRHDKPVLTPHKSESLLPEHSALRGKWATVDLPDGDGVARLRIFAVTVRRDGRVRAEMRDPTGSRTVYRTPEELRDVSDRQ